MNQNFIYCAKIQNQSLNSSDQIDENQKSQDQSLLNLDSFLRLNENDYWSDEIIDINHILNDQF